LGKKLIYFFTQRKSKIKRKKKKMDKINSWIPYVEKIMIEDKEYYCRIERSDIKYYMLIISKEEWTLSNNNFIINHKFKYTNLNEIVKEDVIKNVIEIENDFNNSFYCDEEEY
jgi:hypothetical protein